MDWMVNERMQNTLRHLVACDLSFGFGLFVFVVVVVAFAVDFFFLIYV